MEHVIGDINGRGSQTIVAIAEGSVREIGVAVVSHIAPTLQLLQYCDVTTFYNTLSLLYLHSPVQVLMPSTSMNLSLDKFIQSQFPHLEIKYHERSLFSETIGESSLKELICVSDRPTMDVLVTHKYLCLSAAACLLHHLCEEHDITFLPRSLHLDFRTCDGFLMLDPMTIQSLELIGPNLTPSSIQKPQLGGKSISSLFDVLNHTRTPQGARLLKSNLIQAPCDLATIQFRQSCTAELLSNEDLYFGVSKALMAFGDLEPILNHFIRISASQKEPQSSSEKRSKIKRRSSAVSIHSNPSKHHNAPETVAHRISQAHSRIGTLLRLKRSLNGLETLKAVTLASTHPLFVTLDHTLSHPDLQGIYQILNEALSDVNAPLPGGAPKFRKGMNRDDLIFALKDGVNGLLDAARRVYLERVQDVQDLVDGYKRQFPQLSLKVFHNATRGYYLSLLVSMDEKKATKARKSAEKVVMMNSDETGVEESMNSGIAHGIGAGEHWSNTDFKELPDIFILRTRSGHKLEFTSEDLIALNGRLTEAMHEISILTSQLLENVQNEVSERIGCLYKFNEGIALLDLIFSLATYVTLSPEKCCCPEFLDDQSLDHIQIVKSYHPLILARTNPNQSHQRSVSQSTSSVQTIPNDIKTSKKGAFCHIITGRNNSGKTTYLLQIGTLLVMAHMGCYIPASFASLSLVDRILTRISTQDMIVATSDPMANSSAFYKEMCDTAYILNSSSPSSVVLLDEIGKSTSSDDGVPICMAISEMLIERKVTMFFATHFLDMASKLQDLYPEVLVHMMFSNESLSSTSGDKLIQTSFRVIEGVEDESAYGIDLASDAGWPSDTISFARYLRDHESKLLGKDHHVSIEYSRRAKLLRLQRNTIEQLLIAKRSKMDSVNLHVFLHKLATRYRENLSQITD